MLGNDLTVTANGTQVGIFAPISGDFAIIKEGATNLVLSNAANSYTGGTLINSGTVNFNNAGGLGTTGAITFAGTTWEGGVRMPMRALPPSA